MGLLAVDLALLRDVLLPGLTLSEGRVVAARVVAADTGGGGQLAIAGYLLDAELPPELSTGATVHLEVRDVGPERVLLAVAGHDAAPGVTVPPGGLPLPGGARLTVSEDDPGSGGYRASGRAGTQSLSLRLQMPRLGDLDVRLELTPGGLRATIAVPPGETLTRAQAAAAQLRASLTDAAQRPASVTVITRRNEVEIYA